MADVSDERITHAMFSSAPFDFSHEEIFAMLTELQARRAADAKAVEALNRYRYAVSFLSADSWDMCGDCRDRLQWARGVDGEYLTEDQMVKARDEFFAATAPRSTRSPQ
ncbi:MAG: hypothetical protein KGS44_13165 [Alphaproteobacteria bacterium]|nr:hypothetical protein [Alphaproteobacteria bacterium]